MGRRHCHGVSAAGLHKGPWTEEEDAILTAFVNKHGEGNWRSLPKLAGTHEKRIQLFQAWHLICRSVIQVALEKYTTLRIKVKFERILLEWFCVE